MIEEAGGADEHIGTETAWGDRDGCLGRCRLLLRLRDGLERLDELVALLRVLQDVERPTGIVLAYLRVDGRRKDEKTGKDQQANHHQSSGQLRARSVNKMAVTPLVPPLPSREGLGGEGGALYITPVKTFLAIMVALLMFATLGVLFAGLLGLARGGGDPARSNQLMRWRVILQGAALLLFMLLMTLLRS